MDFHHDKTVSDSEAVLKVQRGEIDYFTHIVHRYSSRIRLYVSRRLYNKEEADDIVQESFISFYRAIERIDPARPVFPYLMEIVKNEMKMFFRKNRNLEQLHENMSLDHKEQELIDVDIERFLQSIPPDQKKALSLVTEGFSYQEIAEKLKKPLNTIRTLIRRGKLAVQKQYRGEKRR